MLRGVIFDHDGTLVDSEKQHLRAWNQLLQEYGHHLPEEEYLRFHSGIPTVGSAERLISRFNLPLDPASLTLEKQKCLQQFQDVPPLMPGAQEVVIHLHQLNIPLAVASGARFAEVERNLRHHKLYDHFGAVCTSNHVASNKPAPDVYLLAAEKLGLAPEQCVAVEDTATGMRSALAAGMTCVVIPGPGAAHHDFGPAHLCLPSLGQLAAWLKHNLIKDSSID